MSDLAPDDYDDVLGSLLIAHAHVKDETAKQHIALALEILLPGGLDE